MTHGTLNLAEKQTSDRWEVMRRAEDLRAKEARRLMSALSQRIRAAFAAVTGRRPAIERVIVPRRTYSAIF